LLFWGGVTRIAKQGEIGVHQFFQDVALRDPNAKIFNAMDLSAQQFVSALVVDYVYRMGVDPRFASIASAVPPSSIRFFTNEEADELKVSWDPRRFEAWVIEPYGNGVVAFSRSRDKTLTATVFCRRDRVPRLLFTDRFSFEGFPRIQSAVAGLEGITVFGLTLSKGTVLPRQAGERVGYEVALNGFNPRTLTGMKSLSIEGNIYRADEAFFDFQLSAENAVPAMLVALRNCL